MAEAFLENIQTGYGYSDYTDPINMINNYNTSYSYIEYVNNSNINTLKGQNRIGYYRQFQYQTRLSYAKLDNVHKMIGPAFYQCQHLTELYLPECKTIGDYGHTNYPFSGCTSLKKLYIPNAVILGDYLFYNALSSEFSEFQADNCKIIGYSAFGYTYDTISIFSLSNLEMIQTPNTAPGRSIRIINLPKLKYIDTISSYISLTYYGNGRSLEYLNLGEIENLKARPGVTNRIRDLINTQSALSLFVASKLKNIYSMETILGIATYTMANSASLIMPELEKIIDCGSECFYGFLPSHLSFPKLKYITHYSNSYGYYFWYNYNAAVCELNFPELEILKWSGTFIYANGSRSACSIFNFDKLRELSCSSFLYGVSLKELRFPELRSAKGRIYYGGYTKADWNMSHIYIPKLKSIGNGMFSNIYGVKNLDAQACEYVGSTAFYECQQLSIISMQKCSYVGELAFANCVGLRTINMPNVTYISAGAFSGTQGRYINLKNCSYIGDNAFYFTSIGVANFDNVETVRSGAFAGCQLLGFEWHPCINNSPIESEYYGHSYVRLATRYIYYNSLYDYSYYVYGTIFNCIYSNSYWYYSTGSKVESTYEIIDWMDDTNSEYRNDLILPKCTSFIDPFKGDWNARTYPPPTVTIKNLYLPECTYICMKGWYYNYNSSSTWYNYNVAAVSDIDTINVPKATRIALYNIRAKTLIANGLPIISGVYTDSRANFIYSDEYRYNSSTASTCYLENLYLDGVSIASFPYDFNFPSGMKKISLKNAWFLCYKGDDSADYKNTLEDIDIGNVIYTYNFLGNNHNLLTSCHKLKNVKVDNLQTLANEYAGDGIRFNDCNSLKSLYFRNLKYVFTGFTSYDTYYRNYNSFSRTLFPSSLDHLYLNISSAIHFIQPRGLPNHYYLYGSSIWTPYRSYYGNNITIHDDNIYQCIHDTDYDQSIFISNYWSIDTTDKLEYHEYPRGNFSDAFTLNMYQLFVNSTTNPYPYSAVPPEFAMPKCQSRFSSVYLNCDYYASFSKYCWIRKSSNIYSSYIGMRYLEKKAGSDIGYEVNKDTYVRGINKIAFKNIFGNPSTVIHIPQSLYSYYESTFLNAMDTLTMMRDDPMN